MTQVDSHFPRPVSFPTRIWVISGGVGLLLLISALVRTGMPPLRFFGFAVGSGVFLTFLLLEFMERIPPRWLPFLTLTFFGGTISTSFVLSDFALGFSTPLLMKIAFWLILLLVMWGWGLFLWWRGSAR